MITDQQQRIVWKWDNTDPFGGNVPDEDPDGDGTKFEFNLRFPGQYFDQETGLHYNYQRWYDPAIGRFPQADPLGIVLPSVPTPGKLNQPYAYADNNPLSNVDPLGLCPCTGGVWDQEFGDFGFQVAAGGYLSVANLNLACRSNKSLKCSGKQVCIGGGPIAGGGIGWALGGQVTGVNDSNNLPGWSGFGGTVSSGPFSGQAGAGGMQTSVGPNVGWAIGGALIRCLTYYVKCNCPCE